MTASTPSPFQRLNAARWEIHNHAPHMEEYGPSCWYIFARVGKRENDLEMVTGVVTRIRGSEPDSAEKIAALKVIAQKICDDHNTGLPE